MIQVRKIKPGDIELLYQNSEELCFDTNTMLSKLDSMMLVINGNKVCGIGCGILAEDKCLLNWINIAKDNRRDRLGTALVKTILNNAELSGSKIAYLSGTCDQFAASLNFSKVETIEEQEEIEGFYRDNYADSYMPAFYKASLEDYFKPCCSK